MALCVLTIPILGGLLLILPHEAGASMPHTLGGSQQSSTFDILAQSHEDPEPTRGIAQGGNWHFVPSVLVWRKDNGFVPGL